MKHGMKIGKKRPTSFYNWLSATVFHKAMAEMKLSHDDKRITPRIPPLEDAKGRKYVLSKMEGIAKNVNFIKKMKYEPHNIGDVILITGVGEAFPFIRVHSLLDAMQPHFSDVPILVMYPGTFDGRYVRLFDRLTPNPYYRAFNIV